MMAFDDPRLVLAPTSWLSPKLYLSSGCLFTCDIASLNGTRWFSMTLKGSDQHKFSMHPHTAKWQIYTKATLSITAAYSLVQKMKAWPAAFYAQAKNFEAASTAAAKQ